jgi:hypothetical protein
MVRFYHEGRPTELRYTDKNSDERGSDRIEEELVFL